MITFFLGIALPVLLVLDSILCFTGQRTHIQAIPLTQRHVTSLGMLELGMGLCTHAWFFEPYDNRPVVRYVLLVIGSISAVIGFVFEFVLS